MSLKPRASSERYARSYKGYPLVGRCRCNCWNIDGYQENEFHMNYPNSVYKSALHMWGSLDQKKRFFTKKNFHNMFVDKDEMRMHYATEISGKTAFVGGLYEVLKSRTSVVIDRLKVTQIEFEKLDVVGYFANNTKFRKLSICITD